MPSKRRDKRAASVGLQDDPFAHIMKPPPDETPDERAKRLSEEQDAAKRSQDIDEVLAAEKREMERRNKMIKVLLLGQAESGKSTTLKNFQLTFAPAQFHAQRRAWRAVIQLNLIASVHVIIEALQSELAAGQASTFESTAPMPFGHADGLRRDMRSPSPTLGSAMSTTTRSPVSYSRPKTPTRRRSAGPDTFGPSSPSQQHQPMLTTEHRKLIMRLGPLLQVEQQLVRAISPESPDRATYEYEFNENGALRGGRLTTKGSRELVVRAGSAWMRGSPTSPPNSTIAISNANGNGNGKGYTPRPSYDEPAPEINTVAADTESVVSQSSRLQMFGQPIFRDMAARMSGSRAKEKAREREGEKEREDAMAGPAAVLAACSEDVATLWTDPIVREVLKKREVDIQSYPGFFLDDAARIARVDYEPTSDDILRARVQTLGVEEHCLQMEATTNGQRKDWMIYDVGGHRSNRHKWIPYFEDVDAIIFLAPLVFTQMLQEDPTVNRVEDSIHIWKKVCANPLLTKATLILFLNKMDIVARTLADGAQLKDYVPSYGDQPNELENVVKYFRSKFKAYMKTLSPVPRHSYCHETSVTDAEATSAILEAVREGIIIHNLAQAHVI